MRRRFGVGLDGATSLLVLALTRLDAKGFAPRIRELAGHIATSQHRDGTWGYRLARAYETALAILFLSRATYPPRKGATTPPDRVVTVTPAEKASIANAKTHSRAFEIYLGLEPKARVKAVAAIGARGPGMVDKLIALLAVERRGPARVAALDLLQRLLGKRFLYLTDAAPDDRKVMAEAIRATWERLRNDVAWDAAAGRYVAK